MKVYLLSSMIDIKLLGSTFAAIFLAELGDKTQLATLSLAAGATSRWTVFVASALALVCSSALAVLLGESLTRLVSPAILHRVAGGIFLVLGALYLSGKG